TPRRNLNLGIPFCWSHFPFLTTWLEAENGRVPRLGTAMRRRDFIKALGSRPRTRRRRVRACASCMTARCRPARKPLSRPCHQCVISRLKYEEESMSEVDGATLIARSLKQQGIDHLFGVVGFRSPRSPQPRRRKGLPISACATSRPPPTRRRPTAI